MEKIFVIKNNKTGRFIGIDKNSGGYPYDCEITGAKLWTDKKSPKEYANKFRDMNVSLHKIIVEDKSCDW